MNRGSDADLGDLLPALSHASMRPRFMNRGSIADWLRGGIDARASMRPRFMNRGSQAHRDAHRGGFRASMRPRFMNRGST